MDIRILCLGDVVGSRSCEYLQKTLPRLRSSLSLDAIIANGENSADGNGITPLSAEQLFASGVDIITGGNHTVRRKNASDLLEERTDITRPYNLCNYDSGRGTAYLDLGRCSVSVINLCGTVYMEGASSAFDAADKALDEVKSNGSKIILVDIHAEATSEKVALGLYLDGRVSAVFGTHTHIPTADLTVLPGGTGYVTDLGMCGPELSVLGIDKDIIIGRFKGNTDHRFRVSENKTVMQGCVFTIDSVTGKCISAERITV